VIDRGGAPGDDGGMGGDERHRAVEPDAAGRLRQGRHDLERFERMVPMPRGTAEATVFDRAEDEAEAKALGQQRHRLVLVVGGNVLRGCCRDDPAVLEDREKHAKLDHGGILIVLDPLGVLAGGGWGYTCWRTPV